MNETNRRQLLQRLSSLAVLGYVAPQVVRIDAANAARKRGRPPFSGFPPGKPGRGRPRRRSG